MNSFNFTCDSTDDGTTFTEIVYPIYAGIDSSLGEPQNGSSVGWSQSFALVDYDGECGTAITTATSATTTPATKTLCSVGVPIAAAGTTNIPELVTTQSPASKNWEWQCQGGNYPGSITKLCKGPSLSSTATCGSADGVTAAAAPSTNLCTVGTASAVTTNTSTPASWIWQCNDNASPSSSVSCSAPSSAMDGECGAANGNIQPTKPKTQLCSVGTASAITFSNDFWNWSCATSSGGIPASCSTQKGKNSGPPCCWAPIY